MESLAKDLVNAGLGAAGGIKRAITDNSLNIANTISGLKIKGATNHSEQAQKIRDNFDFAEEKFNSLTKKFEDLVNVNRQKVNQIVDNVKISINNLSLHELQVGELKDKLEYLLSNLDKNTNNIKSNLVKQGATVEEIIASQESQLKAN